MKGTQERTTVKQKPIKNQNIINLLNFPRDAEKMFNALERAIYSKRVTIVRYSIDGLFFLAIVTPATDKEAFVVEIPENTYLNRKYGIKFLWKNYLKFLKLLPRG